MVKARPAITLKATYTPVSKRAGSRSAETRSPAQESACKDLGCNGQSPTITSKAAYTPTPERAGSRSAETRSPAQESACKDLGRNGQSPTITSKATYTPTPERAGSRSFYFQIESRVQLGENEGHNYVLEMMFVSTIFMRVAMPADIPAMMKVIASARQFLGAQGIDQWQGTYPDQAAIEQDIATGIGRVLIVDGRVAGVAALVVGPDPHYLRIDGAGWLADVPYLAVHRFALDGIRGKQLSRVFFSNIMSEAYRRGFDDLRVDTHAKNVIMQHAITGMGFDFRGIVYMDEPVPERNAYEVRLTSV